MLNNKLDYFFETGYIGIFMRNLHPFFWIFFFYHWPINFVLQEYFQTWSSAQIWNLNVLKTHGWCWIVDLTLVNSFLFLLEIQWYIISFLHNCSEAFRIRIYQHMIISKFKITFFVWLFYVFHKLPQIGNYSDTRSWTLNSEVLISYHYHQV